jgi:hypothetical protein
VEPPASWIVFRHAAHGILGAIRLSGVSAGPSQGIHQLLLSAANSPIRNVVISPVIVDGSPDIELIDFRLAEHSALGFGILIQVVIPISKEHRQRDLVTVHRIGLVEEEPGTT